MQVEHKRWPPANLSLRLLIPLQSSSSLTTTTTTTSPYSLIPFRWLDCGCGCGIRMAASSRTPAFETDAEMLWPASQLYSQLAATSQPATDWAHTITENARQFGRLWSPSQLQPRDNCYLAAKREQTSGNAQARRCHQSNDWAIIHLGSPPRLR